MAVRKFFALRIIASFLISAVLFLLIFNGSYFVAYSNLITSENNGKVLESRLNELDSYVNENNQCNSSFFLSLSESLENEGVRIAHLEEKIGKDNFRILSQKSLYSDLEITHMLLSNELNVNCNTSFVSLLFFYSNEEPYRDKSEIYGYVLSRFKDENPSKVMIYSFDVNLNSSSILELEEKYNVTLVPSVFEYSSNKEIVLEDIDDLIYLLD